ncbi:Hypothetical predicted protein [Xyrichtys novacula]|nr:Hypothetical predicted protein [Xyrichtys novacula]
MIEKEEEEERRGKKRSNDGEREREADEEINPVARDETETERKERGRWRFLGQKEGEEGGGGGDGVKETRADMLSPGALIHNSPPWQTFIHILTPHGCAQWSSRPSTSRCLSMDTPAEPRSVSPLLLHFGDSSASHSLTKNPALFLSVTAPLTLFQSGALM